MNIEEKDETQEVDTSLLPDFSLLNIEESDTQEQEAQEDEDDTQEVEFEEKEETDDLKDESSEDEDDIEAITAFYQLFQEKGILPEKEIKSFKDLEDEIEAYKNNLPEQVKESIVSSAPEDVQSLIDYALTKPNATKEDFINYLKAEEQDQTIQSIDSDDKAREYLKAKYSSEFKEKVVEAMLDSMEDEGILLEKAKEDIESQAIKLQQEAQQERQQLEEQNKEWLTSITQEFEAQKWKPEHKQKVIEQFSNGELDQRVQDIISNPKSLVQLANILSYYDQDTKEFNLDTFFTQASTKKTNSVKQAIIASAQNRSSSTKPTKQTKQGFDPSQYAFVN